MTSSHRLLPLNLHQVKRAIDERSRSLLAIPFTGHGRLGLYTGNLSVTKPARSWNQCVCQNKYKLVCCRRNPALCQPRVSPRLVSEYPSLSFSSLLFITSGSCVWAKQVKTILSKLCLIALICFLSPADEVPSDRHGIIGQPTQVKLK